MKNVADIIHDLGKNVEVADGLDVQPSAVSEFKRRNSIPVKHWPRLIAFAATKGIAISAEELMAAHRNEPEEAA